jgi:aromatic-amino-acid transaminase
MTAQPQPRTYLPIDGLATYDKAVMGLLFGADSEIVASGRACTVQALGGTGGLRVGADFLRRFAPGAQVWISDPSWENHRALFEAAGFTVNTYPYYHAPTRGLDFDGMIRALESAPEGHVVVLHTCCHNPTGVDPTIEQWERILATVRKRGLIRSSTWPTRASATASTPTARCCAAFPRRRGRCSSRARSRSRSRCTASG